MVGFTLICSSSSIKDSIALFFFPAEQSAMVLPCFQQLVVVVIVLVVEEVDTKNSLFFLVFLFLGFGDFLRHTC